MVDVERQEIPKSPEENLPKEPRSFPFYKEAEKIFQKGQEIMERTEDDPELLGLAFLKLHGAAERIAKNFLITFRPILKTTPLPGFSDDLFQLHWKLNLIDEIDYKIFLSYMENRNEFAHGGNLSLSKKEIESYVKIVERFFQKIGRTSCGLWEKLVTSPTLSEELEESGLVEGRRNNINDVLVKDIQTYDWVHDFLPEEVSEKDWWVFYNMDNLSSTDFFPQLPISKSDFVVSLTEEPTTKNPGKIELFAKILKGEDLKFIDPETFKTFLGHGFPVVVFIPERLKDEFLAKLKPLRRKLEFITYQYDNNANLQLN